MNHVNYSVSHGTLREEHLMDAFINALYSFDRPASSYYRDEWEKIRIVMDWMEEQFTITELQNDTLAYARCVEIRGHLLECLFDDLNSHAPEGYYFGAHEGNSSNFGFWRIIEDED